MQGYYDQQQQMQQQQTQYYPQQQQQNFYHQQQLPQQQQQAGQYGGYGAPAAAMYGQLGAMPASGTLMPQQGYGMGGYPQKGK